MEEEGEGSGGDDCGDENTMDVRSTRLEGGGGGFLGLNALEGERGEVMDWFEGGWDNLFELLRDTEGLSGFLIWLCRRARGGVGGLLECEVGLGEDSERIDILLSGAECGMVVGMLGRGLWL